ncbi:FHA domain-containing protein [Nocardia sp. NPDC051900]|uniref:FHA domain-containing protein n=1 Tax=Nocardia sp. NPDC051900 TaxID=3364326 RepID=UPI0037BB46D9
MRPETPHPRVNRTRGSPLWAQLITALYRSDRQNDALEACRRVKQILADKLGIDRCAQLVWLEQQVLQQKPILGSQPAATMQAKALLTTVAEIPRTHRSGRLRFDSGRIVEVPPSGLRIGRGPGHDLDLDDPKVSRDPHAQIFPEQEGLAIKDLNSRNGVYVDGARIKLATPLSTGTVIRIGSTTMTFEET